MAGSGTKRADQSPVPFLLTRPSARAYLLPRDYDVRILRVRDGIAEDVSAGIEKLDWGDGDAGASQISDPSTSISMSGSLTARRDTPLDPHSSPLRTGDEIVVEYRDAADRGPWKQEITLDVAAPQSEPATGVVNLTISDSNAVFDRTESVFVYRQDKHHRGGWRMDTIIIDAAEQMGVPVNKNRIAKGRGVFPSPWKSEGLTGSTSNRRVPLMAFVAQTVAKEMELTKRQLLPTVIDGRLVVLEKGASRTALVLDVSAHELQVQSNNFGILNGNRPATAMLGRARIGKGKGSKTIHVLIEAKLAIERYGYILVEREFSHIKGEADLRDATKRALARALRVVRTADTTVKGTPGLLPWDAVVLATPNTPRPGIPDYQAAIDPDEFGGPYGTTFISTRNHSIEGGVWTTQLQLGEQDPYLTYQRRLAERKVGYPKKKHQSPSRDKTGTTS